jgi:DNA-binding transcriptional MerR regulator
MRPSYGIAVVRDSALLTTSDVVHMISAESGEHVSADIVRRWCKRGLLNAERTVGGVFVYRASDVRRLLDRRREFKELRDRGAGELEPPDAA